MAMASTCALLLPSIVLLGAVACAPLSSFRPASGIMDGRTGEVGIGGTMVSPRPYVDERTDGAGQLWLSKRAAKDLTLTGIGAVEQRAFALGGAMRADIFRARHFVVAPEVQLGAVFAAVDGGVALRVWDELWLYTAPRFGNRGSTWALEVPGGVSARLYEDFFLRAEYRVSWRDELSYFQQRRMFGLAVVRQF